MSACRYPRNARFWLWHREGFVKLTLKPGQSLTWGSSGYGDEGPWHEAETITHVGNGIESESASWGRDCDGGYSTDRTYFASMANLAAFETPSGVRVPHFVTVRGSQRDEYAELAGY